jgi:O-methyltransferase
VSAAAAQLYLTLLKQCLRRDGFEEPYHLINPPRSSRTGRLYAPVQSILDRRDLVVVQRVKAETRAAGEYWPASAETMLSQARLDNIQDCVTQVIEDGIPGDLIETGVWRGGATILMRAVLAAYGDETRKVWVADSFQGLPPPDPERYPEDAGDTHWQWDQLAVSVDQVRANFERYGLLDERVEFLPGWFRDTLPEAPIDRLAVLRIDGDMYEGTIDPLRHLYPKLSGGGFVIVDDYGDPNLAGCKKAVDDYRAEHGITEPITPIDNMGIFWRKSGDGSTQ